MCVCVCDRFSGVVKPVVDIRCKVLNKVGHDVHRGLAVIVEVAG